MRLEAAEHEREVALRKELIRYDSPYLDVYQSITEP